MSDKNGNVDKGRLIHIAGEAIALTGITLYLMNRITALENRIAELEKDSQASAKHHLKAEKKHSQMITNATQRITDHDQQLNRFSSQFSQMHQHPHLQPSPPHQHQHQQPVRKTPANKQPAAHSNKPRVEIEEPIDDDQLLESEFGSEEDPEEEEIEEPPKLSVKKGKNVKFKPEKKAPSSNARNMDEIKAKAARLRAAAGDD